MKPWLYRVLLPYTQEAYRIVQGSYHQSQDHNSPSLGGGTGPRSASICPADGPSSCGVFPSPRVEEPLLSFSDGSAPLAPNTSPGDAFPWSLIPE